MKKLEFFTTRPTLATLLFSRGHIGRRTGHPWQPERGAWVFAYSETLAADVLEYYQTIGKEPPRSLLYCMEKQAEGRE